MMSSHVMSLMFLSDDLTDMSMVVLKMSIWTFWLMMVVVSSQKLMAINNPKKEEEKEEEISRMQTDITDEEMALRWTQTHGGPSTRSLLTNCSLAVHQCIPVVSYRYESLIESVRKKFAKKRQRAAVDDDINQNTESSTKRGFLKPQDWSCPGLQPDFTSKDFFFMFAESADSSSMFCVLMLIGCYTSYFYWRDVSLRCWEGSEHVYYSLCGTDEPFY